MVILRSTRLSQMFSISTITLPLGCSDEVRYRSIITSFLHAWRRVAPREIFKYSRSVFAWTTISRGVEHTRLVYHHAWLLHARQLHAWLLHTWLAITRVASYYTRG